MTIETLVAFYCTELGAVQAWKDIDVDDTLGESLISQGLAVQVGSGGGGGGDFPIWHVTINSEPINPNGEPLYIFPTSQSVEGENYLATLPYYGGKAYDGESMISLGDGLTDFDYGTIVFDDTGHGLLTIWDASVVSYEVAGDVTATISEGAIDFSITGDGTITITAV